jgi:hypothetical protein
MTEAERHYGLSAEKEVSHIRFEFQLELGTMNVLQVDTDPMDCLMKKPAQLD